MASSRNTSGSRLGGNSGTAVVAAGRLLRVLRGLRARAGLSAVLLVALRASGRRPLGLSVLLFLSAERGALRAPPRGGRGARGSAFSMTTLLGSKPKVSPSSMVCRVIRSMLFSKRSSSGATKDTASPARPARPVRPIRCT